MHDFQKIFWNLKGIYSKQQHCFKLRFRGFPFPQATDATRKSFHIVPDLPGLHKINKYSCVPARAGLHSAREPRQHNVNNARGVCSGSGCLLCARNWNRFYGNKGGPVLDLKSFLDSEWEGMPYGCIK